MLITNHKDEQLETQRVWVIEQLFLLSKLQLHQIQQQQQLPQSTTTTNTSILILRLRTLLQLLIFLGFFDSTTTTTTTPAPKNNKKSNTPKKQKKRQEEEEAGQQLSIDDSTIDFINEWIPSSQQPPLSNRIITLANQRFFSVFSDIIHTLALLEKSKQRPSLLSSDTTNNNNNNDNSPIVDEVSSLVHYPVQFMEALLSRAFKLHKAVYSSQRG